MKVALSIIKQTKNKTRESDTSQKLSKSTYVGARETSTPRIEANGGVLPKEARFTNIVPELNKTITDRTIKSESIRTGFISEKIYVALGKNQCQRLKV